MTTLIIIAGFIAIILMIAKLRIKLVSAPFLKVAAKALPTISPTEDTALKAGSVWWDGELFSGSPNWNKLLNFKIKKLTDEEQEFLDGPVEKLCSMIDDDEINRTKVIPTKVWNFIKKHKFLGMVIAKEYGGLGFSAAAHSAVVAKVSSRSATVAVTVMVPNSLGPGELLFHYGTTAQKKQYLPNLAAGKDIPCFALTEPHAGSDAANGRSLGIICKGTWKGKKVTGIRLNFNKRYITLAPIATVIGLAFNLHDPEGILGKKKDLGITCALLPRDLKGMDIGKRHDPMGVPFHNGPIFGKDVFIPLDFVIGGKKGVGKGWKMLMEALSIGRSISLPSLAGGVTQLSIRSSSAYSVVREQFGIGIGRFEGIQERLARIASHAYFSDAVRKLTCGAVDAGERPAVCSAVAKAYLTEGTRLALNDAMDIQAGSAICRGENNILANSYASIPVGITVEGANILTRSLMIFGQGAMRCHPYLLKEVNAIQKNDIKAFDKALFGHIRHTTGNAIRSLLLGLTCGKLARAPKQISDGGEAIHYRKLAKLSTNFALISDLALATLGGGLKQKEFISGYFADALAWMYIASATLKQFHDNGESELERPLLNWTMDYAFYEAEKGLIEVLRNFPVRPVAWVLRALTFPFGTIHRRPLDKQTALVSKLVTNGSLREELTKAMYIPSSKQAGLGKLEAAYEKIVAAENARRKLTIARREGKISKGIVENMAKDAKKLKLIDEHEYKALLAAEVARDEVIQVNYFTEKEYLRK